MDLNLSDESDDELYPIAMDLNPGGPFVYNDPLLVTGILRAVVEGDLVTVKELVSAGHSLNINDNNGNTPLHVAVIKNNLQILRYLVSLDDIKINKRNVERETPLLIAVSSGDMKSVKLLVEKGADVNFADKQKNTPLHRSVHFPEVSHMLIKSGANINSMNHVSDTPLHYAVIKNCLESVCMLLYYKADPHALGNFNLSPIMVAILNKNYPIQETFLEYIDNYKNSRLSYLALMYKSPFAEEIIKRVEEVTSVVVKVSIDKRNLNTFKLVWDLPRVDHHFEFNILFHIYDTIDKKDVISYLDVILKSDDETFLKNLMITETKQFRDILFSYDTNLSNEHITQLVCLLLQYGSELSIETILMVYQMGYSELFKILLYMDFGCNWNETYEITPRLIFDIHCDIRNLFYIFKAAKVVMNDCMLTKIEDSLKHFIFTPFIDWLINEYFTYDLIFMDKESRQARRAVIRKRLSVIPKVPSLIQLARDQTRRFIVDKFQFKNACQYYTYINHMDISIVYKNILTLEIPIYKYKLY